LRHTPPRKCPPFSCSVSSSLFCYHPLLLRLSPLNSMPLCVSLVPCLTPFQPLDRTRRNSLFTARLAFPPRDALIPPLPLILRLLNRLFLKSRMYAGPAPPPTMSSLLNDMIFGRGLRLSSRWRRSSLFFPFSPSSPALAFSKPFLPNSPILSDRAFDFSPT